MITNLTAMYANADDPVIIGREKEIELLTLTLMRHEKPNAILYGNPGVGKTSIVHLLAYQIAQAMSPPQLDGFQVLEVNTNALLAGPGYRGVTEQKFEELIDTALNGKTILFFDEFHTVENLGQMANGQTPGLSNMLKPYLTRPDFRVIGATTTQELGMIKDKAFLRRFANIVVPEPTDEAILEIVKHVLPTTVRALMSKTTSSGKYCVSRSLLTVIIQIRLRT